MSTMASQINSLTIDYSTVYSATDKRKLQSPMSLALYGEFTGHRWIPRTNGQFAFDDVIMKLHIIVSLIWPHISSEFWHQQQIIILVKATCLMPIDMIAILTLVWLYAVFPNYYNIKPEKKWIRF